MTVQSVEMIKIKESSNVDRVGYDPASRTLHVLYLSKVKYLYSPVPKELVPGIFTAKSAGKYLHEHIIPKFTARIEKPIGD